MITRQDVLPGGHAPAYIQHEILKCGGRNPFGEPNFRLVIAEYRRVLEAAKWDKYPDGTNLQDRGGLRHDADENFEPTPFKPISSRIEYRWVPYYPSLKGWILEEWHPAHQYGSPEEWASFKVAEDTSFCRLGPYPTYGDYELAAPKTLSHVPPLSAVRTAILFIERQRELWHSMTPLARRTLRESEYQRIKLLQETAEHQRKLDLIRDRMSPLWSSSLEAGRIREEWAKSAGLRSHVGN